MKLRIATWFVVAIAACGSDDPQVSADGGLDGSIPLSARYLPLEVGATWTYEVTDLETGDVADKTSTVEALEDIGGEKAGVEAFRVRTEKTDGITVSWQADTGSSIVRHREMAYDLTQVLLQEEYFEPYKLRLDESDEHVALEAGWEDSYYETQISSTLGETVTARTDQWSVEAVDENLEVPAGTFACLRVRRQGTAAGESDKTYWFAKGVGKVKETGGQTEELVSYSIPSLGE